MTEVPVPSESADVAEELSKVEPGLKLLTVLSEGVDVAEKLSNDEPGLNLRPDASEAVSNLSLGHASIDRSDLPSVADFLAERLSVHLETVVLPPLFAKQLEALTTSIKQLLEKESSSTEQCSVLQTSFSCPQSSPLSPTASSAGESCRSDDLGDTDPVVPPGCVDLGAPQNREVDSDDSSSLASPLPRASSAPPGTSEQDKQRLKQRRGSTSVASLQAGMSETLLASLSNRRPSVHSMLSNDSAPSFGLRPVSEHGGALKFSDLSAVADDCTALPVRRVASTSSVHSADSHVFDNISTLRRRTERSIVVEDMSVGLGRNRFFSCAHLWIPLRVCGFIPWRNLWNHPSKGTNVVCLCYQWLLLGIALLGCVNAILPIVQRSREPLCFSQTACLRIGLFSDLPIALGSFLGLLCMSSWRSSPHMCECLRVIRSYAFREDFEERWQVLSLWEVAATVLVWLAVLVERVRGTELIEAALNGEVDGLTVLHTVVFALSTLILVMLTYLVLHICHGLASAVDAFCATLLKSGDLEQAIHGWNVVAAILREACSSIESCLFVLQATVLFTFLLGAVDFYRSGDQETGNTGSHAALLLPHAILIFGILRVFFKAAAVTEKCTRVPSLINGSTFGGTAFDPKRQYVVQFVEQSAAGFYVTDIRLTSSMTVKFSYICVLGLFTLATRIVSDQ